MKIILIGAVYSSAAFLNTLLETRETVSGVITLDETTGRKRHSDYADLAPICSAAGIPCHQLTSDSDIATIVETDPPDLLLVWGWSRLIPKAVLKTAKIGCIGFHPAPLPNGRGRHPLIWSIILGLAETHVNFFELTDTADEGQILASASVRLDDTETARSLMEKTIRAAQTLIPSMFRSIANKGYFTGKPQSNYSVESWRKRNPADGRIDFRMSATHIDRLVRALSEPYPGADAMHCHGEIAKVWHVETIEENAALNFTEPGRVVEIIAGAPLVRCGDGALIIRQHDFSSNIERGTWFC